MRLSDCAIPEVKAYLRNPCVPLYIAAEQAVIAYAADCCNKWKFLADCSNTLEILEKTKSQITKLRKEEQKYWRLLSQLQDTFLS